MFAVDLPKSELASAMGSLPADPSFEAVVEDDCCVVRATGEIDLGSRSQLVAAVTAGDYQMMVIDLGGVVFMDCSGYGSIVASGRLLADQHRTLSIRGQIGQPARLLGLITELEAITFR